MSDHLTQDTVLVLNKNWQVINVRSPRDAIQQMMSDAATALDIDSDGFMRPVGAAEWMTLPVREQDDFIKTVRGRVRSPRVIIAVNYGQVLHKAPKLTTENLLRRQKGRDAYTGKKLSRNRASREHVLPKSHGGRMAWDNIVATDRDVNSRRGNRSLEEAGLVLRVQPSVPPSAVPAATIINRFDIPEWKPFLIK